MCRKYLYLLLLVLVACDPAWGAQGHRSERGRPGTSRNQGGGTPFINQFSVDLDGTDELVELSDEENLECDTEDEMTFCAWIKVDEWSAIQTVAGKKYYNLGDTTYDGSWIFQTILKSGSELWLKFSIYENCGDRNAAGTVGSGYQVTIGEWDFVCARFDGDASGGGNRDKAQIYVNGTEYTQADSDTVPVDLENCGSDLSLGSWATGSDLVRYFNGHMDEVYMWCDALTAAQINTLYNSGAPIEDPGTVQSGYRVWLRMGDHGSDSHTSFNNAGTASDFVGVNLEAGDIVADVP